MTSRVANRRRAGICSTTGLPGEKSPDLLFATFDSVNIPLRDNFRLPNDATEGRLGKKGI